jgi:DNA polymerase III sliding clamp (beta) subunit (PCNA family)
MFADTVSIECSEEKIVMSSKSNDQGKMFVEIDIDDVSGFAIDEGCELNLSFALTYLHNMCLYNKLAEDIELRFSQNYPMKVVYHLGTNASMSFYLAPKIDDDE